MSNETLWYVCRSAGLTSWVMLTLTMVWGSLISGRLVARPRLRRWLNDIHPFLATIGLGALVLHIVTAIADSESSLGWIDAFVPFRADWNPSAMAWGVVSVWILVVVEATSLLRRRMAKATWHGIHLASYAGAWMMALHAAFAGTDVRQPVVAWASLVIVVATTFFTVWRVINRAPLDELADVASGFVAAAQPVPAAPRPSSVASSTAVPPAPAVPTERTSVHA